MCLTYRDTYLFQEQRGKTDFITLLQHYYNLYYIDDHNGCGEPDN